MKRNAFVVLLVVVSSLASPAIGGQNRVSKSLAIRAAQEYATQLRNDSVLSASLLPNNPVLFSRSVADTMLVEEVSVMDSATLLLVPSEIGWFLVSSSLETTPVLAYLPTMEKPDIANFPPAAKELIGLYEIQIAHCNNTAKHISTFHNGWRKVIARETAQTAMQSIAPLLKKKNGEVLWGQTLPWKGADCDLGYNKFCPTISDAPEQCNKAAAGCVAVAIAQIMCYWEWPHTAKVPTTIGGSNYVLKSYDWKKMPARITSSTPMENVDEVAGLLRDCGYQTDMHYGKGSSANDDDALDALKMFGYNPNTMRIVKKINTEGWSTLFYNELLAGRPVYYGGYSGAFWTNGHAFVIDGYDASKSKYHMNFGWNESGNGLYTLDDITPREDRNYNYYQSAIVGIEPVYAAQTYSAFPAIESPYRIANSEDIALSLTIPANKTLIVCSGSQVRLSNGFVAKAGSNVRIAAVSDMVCPTERVANNRAKIQVRDLDNDEEQPIAESPLSVVKHIDRCFVYNASGQLVQTAKGEEVLTNTLPRGFYAIQTLWDDGSVSVEKVAKQ